MKQLGMRSRQRGFNLIEVMAAVLVVAFGLLGLAKVEAVAVSDTTTSDIRSVVALETQGLAANMHANPGYWQSSSAPSSCSITGATVCSPLATVFTCKQQLCTVAQMAAYDLRNWATTMNGQLPGFSSTVACASSVTNSANSSSSTNTIYACTITVNWSEKFVAVSKAAAAAQAGGQTSQASYKLVVWP